jgi:UPF0755 protein
MTLKTKSLISSFIFLLLIAGGLFYFRFLVYYSPGNYSLEKNIFTIEKGEGARTIGEKLKADGIIKSDWAFYYYLRKNGMGGKILPGEYELSGRLTIPELVTIITSKKEEYVKITFPEGFTAEKMAERLSANGLPGEDFLKLAEDAQNFRDQYAFLADSKIKTLEGFLFPDTYFFKSDDTGEKVIGRMMSNFSKKYSDGIEEKVSSSGRTLLEILTMASIIEGEVKTKEDREIVSGLFWRRISEGQPLQSCASIAYVLGVNKKQYTFEDTRVESLYNTYLHPGLPPGPINNPGLDSILVAITPMKSDFLYFLSDPATGKTVFSRTIEEHNANKAKCGL